LDTFKKLKWLNLSSNELLKAIEEEKLKSTTDYFAHNWQLISADNYASLSCLILNACQIDLPILECLLQRLPNLSELHLARNSYQSVSFGQDFQKPSVKILYFNDNLLEDWQHVVALGKCFPNLEQLVLSDNLIERITDSSVFQTLKQLNLNKTKINDWSSIEKLDEFASLKHLRIQNIKLVEGLSEEEKFFMLTANVSRQIEYLNGSLLTEKDRDESERKFLRHFMKKEEKPGKYSQLEEKHGKLVELADVNLKCKFTVDVIVKCKEKTYYEHVDTRDTVAKFKKYLEKYAKCPPRSFRLFYNDIGGPYGADELKLPNLSLSRFGVKDGDEFYIEEKTNQPGSIAASNISVKFYSK
jgi:hypothetical protein